MEDVSSLARKQREKMLSSMKPIIISAPFGNYIEHVNATPTIGTFTLKKRGGMLYRLWRCIRTLRPTWKFDGYVNKLGLPNPGIDSLQEGYYHDKIISIYGFDEEEWYRLTDIVCNKHHPIAIELNLSCPNLDHKVVVNQVLKAIKATEYTSIPIIAKLPPYKWMDMARPLYDVGVKAFHCCNTIKTPAGGLSGKVLKQYSLWAVEEIRNEYNDGVFIIGGGGVTDEIDVAEYLMAGANRVAIASMLFRPFSRHNIESMSKVILKKGDKQWRK